MTERDHSPDAPPTAEEIAEAEALRAALADPSRPNAAADFARAVALSREPRELSSKAHEAIASRSMARGELRRAAAVAKRSRLVFAVAGGLAMAAAVALFVGPSRDRASMSTRAIEPLVPARSTQALFHEPFARTGGESARIDRIASARASDLRDNRFATWGIR